jgi:hypothetical protein
VKEFKKIPHFETEADERAFWENPENDTSDYFDWSKAQLVEFPNLKATKFPK